MPSVRVTQLPGLYLSLFPPLSFPPTQNPRACSPPFPLDSSSRFVVAVVVNVLPDPFSPFLSLFLLSSLCFSLRFSLQIPRCRTQLGKTIIICARVPSTLSSQNPTIVAILVFLAPLFRIPPSFPTPEATLPLAESWTHYVVIYEQDNGAWQPSDSMGKSACIAQTLWSNTSDRSPERK